MGVTNQTRWHEALPDTSGVGRRGAPPVCGRMAARDALARAATAGRGLPSAVGSSKRGCSLQEAIHRSQATLEPQGCYDWDTAPPMGATRVWTAPGWERRVVEPQTLVPED